MLILKVTLFRLVFYTPELFAEKHNKDQVWVSHVELLALVIE